jgi:site-specific recombinase XerD
MDKITSLFDSGSGYNAKPRKHGAFALLGTVPDGEGTTVGTTENTTDFSIMPLLSSTGHPYKQARVIIPKEDAVDPRIYIECYVFDALKNKMVRKRYYRHKDVKDRKRLILLLKKDCIELDRQLAAGGILNGKGSLHSANTSAYKQSTLLIEGLQLALDSKSSLRAKTYRNYKLYGNDFIKWLKAKGYEKIKAAELNKLVVDKFKKFLTDSNYGNRTINNYLDHVQTLFEYIVSIELATDNPFKKVDRLPVGMGRNIAFTKIQQRELVKFMGENCPEMLTLCKFMYYTMARPNEIANMRVKWVGMKATDKIYLPEEISKSTIERNITITGELQKMLSTMHLEAAKPDWFLFSAGLKPGPILIPANKIADRFTTKVLKKILLPDGSRKYGPEYTLYSWKHTSVVNNYRGGMSRAALKQQLGYKYDYSLEAYLKSLALIDEPDLKNKFVAI